MYTMVDMEMEPTQTHTYTKTLFFHWTHLFSCGYFVLHIPICIYAPSVQEENIYNTTSNSWQRR